ncbi:MAG: sigma-70 family RNA polymerase sigma factor [Lachnospiraceae bacterium]|nr:sigma-70 family RNA polymerase sigma factor [Lachnospiraceae bacterium]
MEDKDIIDLYLNRNENAIAATMKKYENYCYSIAYSILNNQEDSEECVNDTWLRAWKAIPPQIPNCFRVFLGKITRNLSFDKYKKENAQKRGGNELSLVLEELEECIPDAGNNVEDIIIEKELGQIINLFVKELPLKYQKIFVRRYFFVNSIEEISAMYGVSPNNVMVILCRVRKKLKEYLERENYYVR